MRPLEDARRKPPSGSCTSDICHKPRHLLPLSYRGVIRFVAFLGQPRPGNYPTELLVSWLHAFLARLPGMHKNMAGLVSKKPTWANGRKEKGLYGLGA